MKKLILLSIILIVGCSTNMYHKNFKLDKSTAYFKIGMTEEEFKVKNPNLRLLYEDINKFSEVEKILFNEVYYHEKEAKIISWLFFGSFSDYYFYFKNDSLLAVYYGGINIDINKEIDYSKYPNSKPE